MATRAGGHARLLAFSLPKNVASAKSSWARFPGLLRSAARSPPMTRTCGPKVLVSRARRAVADTKTSAGRR